MTTNYNQKDFDSVEEGVVRAIRHSGNQLETTVRKIDKSLPQIKASEMAEYLESLKALATYQTAIADYETAIRKKIQKLNGESAA